MNENDQGKKYRRNHINLLKNFIFWLLAKILKILQTSYFVRWYGPFEKLNSKILKILQIKYVVQWHGPFGK